MLTPSSIMSLRWLNTSLSKGFMTTDVRATGLVLFNPVMVLVLETGTMLELLKHEDTSHTWHTWLLLVCRAGRGTSEGDEGVGGATCVNKVAAGGSEGRSAER